MSSGYDTSARNPWAGRGYCGSFGWRPIELVALVLGFAIYWPLGLAVLGWKIAQKKGLPVPDIFGAASERVSAFARGFGTADRKAWRPFADSTSGNAAFDDWRKAELARLEEERRKLEAAEREFAEHMETLRRARDREEFDRFMAGRANRG
jgi:Protein of unknown function (DUF2852)